MQAKLPLTQDGVLSPQVREEGNPLQQGGRAARETRAGEESLYF